VPVADAEYGHRRAVDLGEHDRSVPYRLPLRQLSAANFSGRLTGRQPNMFAAFHTILVALDGHQGGLDAAALAGRLTGAEADVAFAHVVAHDARRTDGGYDAAIRDAQRILDVSDTRPADASTPILTVRCRSVTAGLRELVDARGADLLVLGAHHHRQVSLRSRNHTRAALREMRCALAVAPWEYSKRPHRLIRSIGVGYVDDNAGRIVLDTARALAWQLGAEVHATTVVAPSNWEAADSGVGWKAAAAGRRMGEIPGVHGTAVEGEPHHALLAFSDEVDLLVIGSGHHRALRHLLLGDVAEDLSRTSRCPILVLTHPPRT
jgi:nucleotide-binding universal stress UspA family protein